MSKNSIIDHQMEMESDYVVRIAKLSKEQIESFRKKWTESIKRISNQKIKFTFIESEWIDLQKSNRPLIKKKYEI